MRAPVILETRELIEDKNVILHSQMREATTSRPLHILVNT
jgi:hypothetical protein